MRISARAANASGYIGFIFLRRLSGSAVVKLIKYYANVYESVFGRRDFVGKKSGSDFNKKLLPDNAVNGALFIRFHCQQKNTCG